MRNGLLCAHAYNTVRVCLIFTMLHLYFLYFRHGENVLLNSSAGYLVRSKPAAQSEAGVGASGAAIDSIILT